MAAMMAAVSVASVVMVVSFEMKKQHRLKGV
jgi:hypothetical protein